MKPLVQMLEMGNTPATSGSGPVTLGQFRGDRRGIQSQMPDEFAERDMEAKADLAVQLGLRGGILRRPRQFTGGGS